jgi:O-antigen/teichoic acid export membrane protein
LTKSYSADLRVTIGEIRETPSHVNDMNKTFRATAAYTLGNVIQRGLSFIMLPFFTRALIPAQYGQLSVAFAITGVASVIMTFGLELTAYRTYFQLSDDKAAQRRYVHTAWTFLIVAPMGLAVVVTLISIPLLSGVHLVTPLIMLLSLVTAALNVAATRVPYVVLRAEQRLRDFMVINIGFAAFTAAASATAVLVLRAGVIGWLVAVVLANVVEFGLALWVVPFRRHERLESRHLKQSLRLGIPLVPHYMSQWSLQLADRLVLATLVSGSALGVYSLGANIATPMMVLVSSVSQALLPTYARASKQDSDARELPRTILMQVGIVALVTVAGALLAPSMVHLLTPRVYGGAGSIAPWIVLGYGFFGVYWIPIALAGITVGKTKRIWIITVAAAATNVGMIVLLVPSSGVESAAIASAVGYAVLFVGVAGYAHLAGNPARIPWRSVGATLLVCASIYSVGVATASDDTLVGAIMRLAWCGAALAAVAVIVAGSPRRLVHRVVRRQVVVDAG